MNRPPSRAQILAALQDTNYNPLASRVSEATTAYRRAFDDEARRRGGLDMIELPAPTDEIDTVALEIFLQEIPRQTRQTRARVRSIRENQVGACQDPREKANEATDDHVDLACLDIGDQLFQSWPLHRAAGKPAIIIERRQHRPAFVLLRENEGGQDPHRQAEDMTAPTIKRTAAK
jgi:hypothetical protein